MLSLRRGPIARRLQALTERARAAVRLREAVRNKARALASIRAALADTGVDPADNAGLHYYAGAQSRLAELADTPARQQADTVFIAADPILAARPSPAAEAAFRALHFLDGPPDDDEGSPFDWYAWSLAIRFADRLKEAFSRLGPAQA